MKPLLGASLLSALALISTSANAGIIASYDFEAGNTTGWSSSSIATAPNAEKFLGEFNNGTVSYSQSGIGAYSSLTVEFDLYILKSWDGEGQYCCGPDDFSFSLNGSELLNYSFSNTSSAGNYGSFPDSPTAVNSLGYGFYGDSIYHLSFTTNDYSSILNLAFSATGLQPIADESWGLDNVVITTVSEVPAPASIALMALGLATLQLTRRQKANA